MLASLWGHVARPGVYEVRVGTPIAKLIQEQGGGAPDGVSLVFPAGPSAPPLTADRLDTPLEADALAAAGSALGTASVMLVLGGGVRGGRVVGGYRGLTRTELFEERDLAIGTDVRSVLWEAVRGQLALRDASTVFPGFSPGSPVLG